jgi:hypothetical protein
VAVVIRGGLAWAQDVRVGGTFSLAILSGGSGGETKLRKDRNGRAMVQRDEPEPLVPPPGAAAAPGSGVDLVAVPAAEEDRLHVRSQGGRRGRGGRGGSAGG